MLAPKGKEKKFVPGPLSIIACEANRLNVSFRVLYSSIQVSVAIEYVPGDSEQFQVEEGISSTSLMTMAPGTAGAGTGVPGTAGGILGAHPWPFALDAETERAVMLRESIITRATTTKCRTSPPSSLFFCFFAQANQTRRAHKYRGTRGRS